MQFPIPPFFTALIIESNLQGTGVFLYQGTPASGNPPIAALVASGVTQDPFSNNLVGNGVTAGIDTSVTNVTPITVTAATGVVRITGQFPIKANNPNPGTIYRLNFGGLGVMGSTAVGFSFILGVTGNNFLQITFPSSLLVAGNAFQFSGYMDLIFTANGVSGNANVVGLLTIWDTTTGNAATFAPLDQNNTLNTTVNNTAELDFQWSAASAGRSITNLYSSLMRIGV